MRIGDQHLQVTLFGKLDEERIAEIAKTQYPSDEMEAWTIQKDFRTALCPDDPFEYDGVESKLDGALVTLEEDVQQSPQSELF